MDRRFRVVDRLIIGVMTLACACGGEAAQTGETSASQQQSDAASTPAAAGPEHACALMPAADVSAIIGQTVRDSLALRMPATGATMLSQCNYASNSDPSIMSVMLRRPQGGETIQQASQGARQTLEATGPVQDVAGVGDIAFWGMNQLHVLVNSGMYLIITPPRSGGLDQAKAIATKALERL